jgi:hypothetical protein
MAYAMFWMGNSSTSNNQLEVKEVAEKHSHLHHVEDALEESYRCIMGNERAR